MKAVLVRLQNVDYIVVAVFKHHPAALMSRLYIYYILLYVHCTYILYIVHIYILRLHTSLSLWQLLQPTSCLEVIFSDIEKLEVSSEPEPGSLLNRLI